MVYTSDVNDGRQWSQVATLSANASLNMVVHNACVYVLDGTDLKVSSDGINFDTVLASAPISRLVAQSSVALYGIGSDGKLMSSKDDGLTWEEEDVDFGSKIPSRNINYCTVNYPSVPNSECVVITGNRDLVAYPADSTGVVITKIVEKSSGSKDYSWSGVTYNTWDSDFLPRLENLTVFNYNNALYAFGGAGIGGCKDSALNGLKKSIDYGFSWSASEDVILPSNLNSSKTAFTAFADENGSLWIICGGTGDVWKGQLNKVGWGD